MKTRVIAVLLLTVLILSSFLACTKKEDATNESVSDTATETPVNPNAEIITIKDEQYNINLTELDLNKKSLLNSDIEQLIYMENLTSLRLWQNQIDDISVLENLTNLKELYVGSNPINNITALNNLTNLTHLGLQDCIINDISVLSNLTNLTYLRLQGNQINDISVLKGLTKLTYLELSKNPLTDEQIEEARAALPACEIRWE